MYFFFGRGGRGVRDVGGAEGAGTGRRSHWVKSIEEVLERHITLSFRQTWAKCLWQAATAQTASDKCAVFLFSRRNGAAAHLDIPLERLCNESKVRGMHLMQRLKVIYQEIFAYVPCQIWREPPFGKESQPEGSAEK